jgi:hypothetical protein
MHEGLQTVENCMRIDDAGTWREAGLFSEIKIPTSAAKNAAEMGHPSSLDPDRLYAAEIRRMRSSCSAFLFRF